MSSERFPKYRLHKPSGQAVVTLDGHDFYLGPHGSPLSRAEYDRLTGEWLANGRCLPRPEGPPTDFSVDELLAAYWRHAEQHYVKDGHHTSELACIRSALRYLKRPYGHTPASKFGPLALKAVRQQMIDDGLTRRVVNGYVGRVKRVFKWAVSNEMIPSSVHHGLAAVEGLRRDRSEARESVPVQPVPEPHVDATRPHVSRQVWAMVELQRLAVRARPFSARWRRASKLARRPSARASSSPTAVKSSR